jgi:hypothetical protein
MQRTSTTATGTSALPGLAMLIGGAVAVMGTFLRWTSLEAEGAVAPRPRLRNGLGGAGGGLGPRLTRFTQAGVDGLAGKIALAAGVVLLLAALAVLLAGEDRWRRAGGAIGVAAAAVAGSFAVARLAANQGPFVRLVTSRGIAVINGPGIWLTILGALAGLLGALAVTMGSEPRTVSPWTSSPPGPRGTPPRPEGWETTEVRTG